MNSNKNYGSGALSELRDLIQEYKNLENNFNEGGEEQEEDDDEQDKDKQKEKDKEGFSFIYII